MSTDLTDVRVEDHAGVRIVLLDRPAKRNALTPAMLATVADLVRTFAADQSAKALVLGGEGPVFCGGFDLKMCLSRPGTTAALLTGLAELIDLLDGCDKPVVIAAHGGAIAGGCALLGAADGVIGNQTGQYGYPVLKLGLSPAVSAPALAELIGWGAARRRLLDVGLIDGHEARRLGLLHQLMDWPEDVLPKAVRLAANLASKPPEGYAATKQLLRSLRGGGPNQAGGETTGAGARRRALAASLSTADSSEMHTRLSALFAPAASSSPPVTKDSAP
ncbi:MAG: enoyl-CoA hydratase/isomerase family protein [bacterium]|jgi:enoyl-CoA hydratase/carnithine racemase|nr:enoyl-CoA hydratase/isomerase family protein [Phycisphaerales bacterium]MCE2653550.1 enoyl-CoA hydratase/isomerase family protein [Planctomycetaceae bacterium]